MTHELQTRRQLNYFIMTLVYSPISTGTLGCARNCARFSDTTITKVHGKKKLASEHIYQGPEIPPLGMDSTETQAYLCTAEDMSSNLTAACVGNLYPVEIRSVEGFKSLQMLK